jgi:hypothetical protein
MNAWAWIFVAATAAFGWSVYWWTVLYLDEHDKQTPLRPRLWDAWKGEPIRYRRTQDGTKLRQFKTVQRYKKERACVRQAEQ